MHGTGLINSLETAIAYREFNIYMLKTGEIDLVQGIPPRNSYLLNPRLEPIGNRNLCGPHMKNGMYLDHWDPYLERHWLVIFFMKHLHSRYIHFEAHS